MTSDRELFEEFCRMAEGVLNAQDALKNTSNGAEKASRAAYQNLASKLPFPNSLKQAIRSFIARHKRTCKPTARSEAERRAQAHGAALHRLDASGLLDEMAKVEAAAIFISQQVADAKELPPSLVKQMMKYWEANTADANDETLINMALKLKKESGIPVHPQGKRKPIEETGLYMAVQATSGHILTPDEIRAEAKRLSRKVPRQRD